MTEPTQGAAAAAASATSSNTAETAGQRAAEAERRSFQAEDDMGRKPRAVSRSGAEAFAPAVAEAGRRGPQSSAPSHEAADLWRASLDSIASLQMEFRQFVDEAWRRASALGLRAPMMMTAHPLAAAAPSFLGQPASDLRETETAYVLSVELPGLSRGDIDLIAQDDVIVVRGHKSEDSERGVGGYRVSERRFGRFERSFPIPRDVDHGGIEASIRDGLLNVVLPRSAAAARGRKIEVKT